MTANQILGRMAARGIRITLAGSDLEVDAPAGMLTDDDRRLLRCYKSELLWRLRHPDGDPDGSGYQVKVIISGEESRVSLDQLIAEGRAIIEREGLRPKMKGLDPDLWAASLALSRHGQAKGATP
jgi:hypothetical protein